MYGSDEILRQWGTLRDPAKEQIPHQLNRDGQKNQEAEIEILCVKHTLLAVAKAAMHKVKLGAKEIDGSQWTWTQLWTVKTTMEKFVAALDF